MVAITDIKQLDVNARYSYADYLKWRLEEYVELFRGKVVRMSPAPLREHQWIAGNIFSRIHEFLRKKGCQVYMAPFDVRLPQKSAINDDAIFTVVQPDVCIICDPQKLDKRGCLGAPDTIIEILSKGNIDRDVKRKFDLYQEHGVREYWIVTPGIQTVTAYQLNDTGLYHLHGEYANSGDKIPVASLPGFSLSWDEIFEG